VTARPRRREIKVVRAIKFFTDNLRLPHDVRKIVAGLAADVKSTSPQKVLCIQLSTLQLVTFVKILKHVREPLGAGFKKSDLEFWKALRNFIHDHVMERADDD
jgi:hypothetical protein